MSEADLHKGVAHYVSKLEFQVKAKRPMVAYSLVQEAQGHFPDDPLIASYVGLLEILMGNKPDKPLEICSGAVKNAKKAKYKKPVRANIYLNLGRASLMAGKKKEAINAFYEGLRLDRNNNDIYWEIKKLGVRRKPPLSFLKRSNMVNKLLGIILFRYLGFKGQTEYVGTAETADGNAPDTVSPGAEKKDK